jgi:leader peptidase (prepilin peptidase) / N-methyltransferase
VTGEPVLAVPPGIVAAVGFILGTIVGSYLATVFVRWPQGVSALGGRSRCDGCGSELRAGELIPILSYVIARGRCRRCGARIDPGHLLIELAGGLIGLAAVMAHPLPLALATALFGWFLLLLAALDVEHHWLPDALTLPLVPLGLGAAALELGPPLLDRLLGAVVGGLSLWLLGLAYRGHRGRAGLGGGDPKLLAGIGAWVGLLQLPFVLLGAGLLGLVALLLMRLRGTPVAATTRLPLGALMALAAWPIWLAGEAIHSAAIQTDLL